MTQLIENLFYRFNNDTNPKNKSLYYWIHHFLLCKLAYIMKNVLSKEINDPNEMLRYIIILGTPTESEHFLTEFCFSMMMEVDRTTKFKTHYPVQMRELDSYIRVDSHLRIHYVPFYEFQYNKMLEKIQMVPIRDFINDNLKTYFSILRKMNPSLLDDIYHVLSRFSIGLTSNILDYYFIIRIFEVFQTPGKTGPPIENIICFFGAAHCNFIDKFFKELKSALGMAIDYQYEFYQNSSITEQTDFNKWSPAPGTINQCIKVPVYMKKNNEISTSVLMFKDSLQKINQFYVEEQDYRSSNPRGETPHFQPKTPFPNFVKNKVLYQYGSQVLSQQTIDSIRKFSRPLQIQLIRLIQMDTIRDKILTLISTLNEDQMSIFLKVANRENTIELLNLLDSIGSSLLDNTEDEIRQLVEITMRDKQADMEREEQVRLQKRQQEKELEAQRKEQEQAKSKMDAIIKNFDSSVRQYISWEVTRRKNPAAINPVQQELQRLYQLLRSNGYSTEELNKKISDNDLQSKIPLEIFQGKKMKINSKKKRFGRRYGRRTSKLH